MAFLTQLFRMQKEFVLPADGRIFIPGKKEKTGPAAFELRGVVSFKSAGLLVLRCESTRPLRFWIGRHLVFEDEPRRDRAYIVRRMLLAATLPVEAGDHAVFLKAGIPARQIRWVDEHCEDPRRDETLAAVERHLPDGICFACVFEEGAAGAALGFRFEPGQFLEGGVLWQDTRVRVLPGFRPFLPEWLSWEEPAFDPAPVLETALGRARSVAPFPGRPADEIRCYVPVFHGEPPAAREPGLDVRGESIRSVVAQTKMTAKAAGGSVGLDIPVFEILGRRSTVREHIEIPAPQPEEVLAAAPRPVLPDEWHGYLELYEAAFRMLCRLWQAAPKESGLPCGFVRTAEFGFENRQFVWDTCFTTLAAAYAHRAFPARASLDALYSRQDDGGMIEREHDTRDNTALVFEPGFGLNPPLFAQAEWAVARLDGDARRLAAVRPVLEAHFDWIWNNRRLGDGTFWTTGLASGLDNSPGQGAAYPCLTAQMAHFAEYLARFARIAGDEARAVQFDERRQITLLAIEDHLWDPVREIYAAPLAEGGFNPHKIITAFWPLWAGCDRPERIEALRRHLEDPAVFNRPHPIPTLAADSPLYRPGGDYWRGSVWAPTNVVTLLGFWRAGLHGTARSFAGRHLDALLHVFRATEGGLWENYAPEALTPGSWSQRNYSWTAASPVVLLLEVLLGLEPDAINRTLRLTLPERTACGVRNYSLGPATLSLHYPARDALEVSTDAAFTLLVTIPTAPDDSPKTLKFMVSPGTHVFRLSTV